MTISFDMSEADRALLDQILDRAERSLWIRPEGRLDVAMDLAATHANGCPLDFQRLLDADDFNLAHDLGGIGRHIDRATGRLQNHFRPRFALKIGRAA